MTFVLFLLGAIGYIMANVFLTTKQMRESVTMIVELKDDITEEDHDFVKLNLTSSNLVHSYKYVTKEEKLEDEEFKLVFDVDIQGILKSNPLPNSYEVTLSEHSANKEALATFADGLREIEGVSYVSYPQSLLEEMHSTLDLFQLILAVFGGVVLVVAFILLNNTIRLIVYARRELINTLKAVGATKWFIMRPFIGRSALQGLLAGLLSVVLLAAALYGLDGVAPGFGFFPKVEVLAIIGGGMVATGILVAVLCTLPIVNRFANMKSNKIHLC
jgi:cell division transport system permease protein